MAITLSKPMTSKAEGRLGKQDFRYLAEEVAPVSVPAARRECRRWSTAR